MANRSTSDSTSYSEKLKDPRWQRKRLEILSRDNFTCACCDETSKTLHVHHKKYQWGMDPWDYPNELLETLCIDCHEVETQTQNDLKEARAAFIKKFDSCSFYARLVGEYSITVEQLDSFIIEMNEVYRNSRRGR